MEECAEVEIEVEVGTGTSAMEAARETRGVTTSGGKEHKIRTRVGIAEYVGWS